MIELVAKWLDHIDCDRCGARHEVVNPFPNDEHFTCHGCGQKWVIEGTTNPDGGVDFGLVVDD